jgi:hypothetical protein
VVSPVVVHPSLMPKAQPVSVDTLLPFEGVLDLRRRTDGKLLARLSYTDVLSMLTQSATLEFVPRAAGGVKYFRDVDLPPERPHLPKLTPFPVVNPLTYAVPRPPDHEKTTDSGFLTMRYPLPNQTSINRWSAIARDGAGL